MATAILARVHRLNTITNSSAPTVSHNLLGNDGPGLVGILFGGWGRGIGAGLSQGEPAPILHFSICKDYEFIKG
jgi:hypothetical protein